MGDIFWDSINEEKQEIIEDLREFCDLFKLEMPEVNTSMRLDVLKEIFNSTTTKFWESQKPKKRKGE